MKIDTPEILRALRLILAPGQVTELRALEATTAGYAKPRTIFGYFDDPVTLAAAVGKIATAKGVYFVPNPVNPALLARAQNRVKDAGKSETTSDRDIIGRRWLLVDCDAVRPAGISASDTEHKAALDRAMTIRADLEERGWPGPIYADSGNGAHLLYRVDLPADDGGLIERCLDALADQHGDGVVAVDRSVHNPARIWKCYGTYACKGDSTVERPHRLARIIEAPDTLGVVTRAQLEELAAQAALKESPPAPIRRANGNGQADAFGFLDAFLSRNAGRFPPMAGPEPYDGGRRWTFDVCPFNPEHVNGSAFLIQRADGVIQAGCRHNSCAENNWHTLRAMIEPKAPPAPRQGPTPVEVPADGAEGEPNTLPPLEPVNFLDLVAENPQRGPAIIDGMLRVGAVGTLIGGSKTRKSWLVCGLIGAALIGGEWLGHSVAKCRVLVIDGELPRSTILWRTRKVLEALGIPESAGAALDIFALRGHTQDAPRTLAYARTKPAGHWGLIVIDPLYKIYPRESGFSENDNAGMSLLLDGLINLATAAGAAVVTVHHLSKGTQAEKGLTDLGAGAGAIARASDAHLALRPHREKDCLVFEGVARDFPELTPAVWRFNFPLYIPAPGLDPTDLAGLRPRKKAQTTAEFLAGGKASKPAPITLDEFVTHYLTPEPRELAFIQATARGSGIHPKAAGQFVKEAVAVGKAFVWPGISTGGRPSARYATVHAPDLLTFPPPPPHPPTAKTPVGAGGGEEKSNKSKPRKPKARATDAGMRKPAAGGAV